MEFQHENSSLRVIFEVFEKNIYIIYIHEREKRERRRRT